MLISEGLYAPVKSHRLMGESLELEKVEGSHSTVQVGKLGKERACLAISKKPVVKTGGGPVILTF